MSTNCLVTKLKASVVNDDLLKPGEIKITATATGSDKLVAIGYNLGDPLLGKTTTTKCSIPATFVNGANNQVIAENVTEYTGSVRNVSVRLPDGVPVTVTITDKYILRTLALNNLNAHILGFEYLPSFEQFYATQDTDYDVTGINLNAFKKSDILDVIQSNALMSGDISVFADKTTLSTLSIGTYFGNRILNINGDVSSLSALVGLDVLSIRDTHITGNMDPVLTAYAASGRTKNLALVININNVQMTDKKEGSNHTIRFNSGMQNPTEAETARGWQVA